MRKIHRLSQVRVSWSAFQQTASAVHIHFKLPFHAFEPLHIAGFRKIEGLKPPLSLSLLAIVTGSEVDQGWRGVWWLEAVEKMLGPQF
ncbi:MAG: hypothetical protein OXF50_22155 [Caldilineaceae bacterium]|nr:hypothetical protein [Caldilineaceae bacterium]